MGRNSDCSKDGLNKGAWTATEDNLLTAFVKTHGEGKWTTVPYKAGLKRTGKSCRLRWLNYLNPNIKRGNFSEEEDDLIIRLHKLLGNRWSLIAGRLPGRTDNEIKNYWNTTLSKKACFLHPSQMHKPSSIQRPPASNNVLPSSSSPPPKTINNTILNRTKLIFPLLLPSSLARKQKRLPIMQLAEDSMDYKVASEMPKESRKVGLIVDEELFQVEENYGSFDDDIIEFPIQSAMKYEGLEDFESWMLNDEDDDYLPDDDQMRSLTSLFDIGGEF